MTLPARAPLTAGPSLDELAADPARVAALPAEVRRVLTLRALAVIGVLAITEPTEDSRAAAPASEDPGDLISLHEAAALVGRHPRWFRRQSRRLPFVRRLSARTIRVSKAGLLKWIAIQKA